MIDEPTLQKLVDGELNNQQIRSLLLDADNADNADIAGNGAAWKQIAVAYAENQMFERGFSEFDTAAVPQTQSQPSVDQTTGTVGRPQPKEETSFNRSGTFWKLALAAALLIGVSIAYQQSQRGADHSNVSKQGISKSGSSKLGTSVANSDQQPPSQPEMPAKLQTFDHDTLLTLKPDLHLKSGLLPPEINDRIKQEVPLYNAKRFDRQQLSDLRGNDIEKQRALFDRLMPSSTINAGLSSDYKKAGLLVDQDIEFFSGRLDDGRAYMIPYRTVRMSSVQ